jgi:dipeptidase E
MKLYLSSYRLGNHAEKLKTLVNNPGARVAVCVNAIDYGKAQDRRRALLERESDDMRSLGFEPEELDLRKYFDNNNLVEKMREFALIWVSGGNVFLLAKAMKQSGFDKVFRELVEPNLLVYAGYSAAFCVLSPSFRGMEFVDDTDVEAEGYNKELIWDGFSLIDFHPIVHFRCNHPESDLVEKEYEYVVSHNIPHKTFRDGDIYIVEGQRGFILAT